MLLMTIPADPGALRVFRQRFRTWLATRELTQDLNDNIVLAVHEALATTIQNAPGDTVAVHASVEEGVIAVDVTGNQWQPQSDEAARQIKMLTRLFEDVEVASASGRTAIRLRQPLPDQ